MLRQIQKRLYKFFLQKKLQHFSADRQISNYSGATQIGVLFPASDPGVFTEVDKYAQRWKAEGKRVQLLGYFKHPVKADVPFPHFSKKDKNFYLHPSSGPVDHFMQQPFDLLLNLFVQDAPALEYVATFSQAKCRVGIFSEKRYHCNDLMIRFDQKPDLSRLLAEMDQFIKKIKVNEAA